MPDRLTITSKWRTYAVDFVDDVFAPLKKVLRERSFVVCDAVVYDLYRDRLDPIISKDLALVVEANEHHKTLDKCQEIMQVLVDHEVRRDHRLVAVGGGIIQDVTAFTASVLYRGIEWVFVPTTLLAQADSCIGSKTSINLGEKKNVIGNFYPPSQVFIDTSLLATLSADDIRSGIGEMLHFFIYAGSPLAERLIADHEAVMADRSRLVGYIHGSLAIKKRVIELDEFDTGERHKFNYGHTFGHAIESLTDYAVKHGQAVTVGMDVANYLSAELGFMARGVYERLHDLLAVNFPRMSWEGYDWDRYVALLAKDKKNLGQDLTCILAQAPGALIEHRLPMNERFRVLLRAYFREEFARTYS